MRDVVLGTAPESARIYGRVNSVLADVLLPLLVFDSPDDNSQKQNTLLESRKVTY